MITSQIIYGMNFDALFTICARMGNVSKSTCVLLRGNKGWVDLHVKNFLRKNVDCMSQQTTVGVHTGSAAPYVYGLCCPVLIPARYSFQ